MAINAEGGLLWPVMIGFVTLATAAGVWRFATVNLNGIGEAKFHAFSRVDDGRTRQLSRRSEPTLSPP